ncbi:MAG: hypothetical protein OCC49_19965 [Fibrobacterales bacterium]
MNINIKSLFLLSTLGVCSSVYAETLHVNSAAEGTYCTRQDPCATIQEAVDRTEPGDVIKIDEGQYMENVFIETSNITLKGKNAFNTIVVAAGGRDGAVGNAGNPLNAVFEIKAPGVTIQNLSIVVPEGAAEKREAGIFAWAGSDGLIVAHNIIERKRDLRIDEPTVPGSRGVFILLSRGSAVRNNTFLGNYEDHVHLPTGGVVVKHNLMVGAARAGLSVMAPDFIPDFPADNNRITHNTIVGSIDAGIHIQGNQNIIKHNTLIKNGGYGVYICGSDDTGCYPPGANAQADKNRISHNSIRYNALGTIADFGAGTAINNNK